MYEVIWADEALDELADAYVRLGVPARERVAAAVQALNRLLADFPGEDSESRPDGSRVRVLMPVIVRFRIDKMAETVRVGHFRVHGRLV